MTRKGWTGRGYQGRGVGHPITEEGVEMKEFDSCVIEVKRIAKMKRTGKVSKTFTQILNILIRFLNMMTIANKLFGKKWT